MGSALAAPALAVGELQGEFVFPISVSAKVL